MKSHASTAFTIFLIIVGLCFLCFVGYSSVTIKRNESTRSLLSATRPKGTGLTPCELLKDRAKYDKQEITVTGFFSHGFEDSSLYDIDCDSRFEIWLEYGGTDVTGTMYCCGVTTARKRPEPLTINGISISLLADEKFKTFDQLMRQKNSSVVRATATGRFFAGEKFEFNGKEMWGGYGHMGCCSLFVLEKVLEVDTKPTDELERQYNDLSHPDCSSSEDLLPLDHYRSYIETQASADSGMNEWLFKDPKRVATETVTKFGKVSSEIIKLTEKQTTKTRIVYEWRDPDDNHYLVVVARPYELSFHARSDRVAWVAIAAYRFPC